MRVCAPRKSSRSRRTAFPRASDRSTGMTGVWKALVTALRGYDIHVVPWQTTRLSEIPVRTREWFLVKSPLLLVCSTIVALAGLSGCQKSDVTAAGPAPGTAPAPVAEPAQPPPAPPPFQITASIQELMDAVIDPSADALWDSVSITTTAKGTVFHQPQSDEEWQEARRHAIALIEGTNLLVMDGRKLVAPGSPVLDQGTSGVLSAEEGAKLFDARHSTFVEFARALRDAGEQMLTSIDKKDSTGMMNAGAAMDGICESCHLTFWYPNQAIPPLPDEFGASKSALKRKSIPLSPG